MRTGRPERTDASAAARVRARRARAAVLLVGLALLGGACTSTSPGARSGGDAAPTARAAEEDDEPPLPGQPGGNPDDFAAPADVVPEAAVGDEPLEAGEPGAGAAPADDGELEVHGSLVTRARHRQGNGDRDDDLTALLSVQVGDPTKDAYTAGLVGRMNRNLGSDTGPSDSFFTLDDTYSSEWHGRLYEAYVDANQLEGFELVRVGRQSLYDTPEFVRFDGALAVTEEDPDNGLQGGAWFGQAYHSYESSPDGDNVAGAFVQARPWQGGRVRLDYMRIEDELVTGEELDHLVAVRLWQQLARHLRVRAGYSRVEGSSRDAELAATWFDPELDLTIQASHKEQLSTQRPQSIEFDDFTTTLGPYAPFRHSRLLVSKGLGAHWLVEGGVEARRLEDDGDEGEFNREFERYHVTGTAREVLADDVDVSVTSEYWDEDQGDSFTTWGADVSQQTTEDLRTSVGVVYARWKNDFLLEDEREDVHTWYARLRWAVDERTSWSFGYDYEQNDIDDFHTLTARMAWRF